MDYISLRDHLITYSCFDLILELLLDLTINTNLEGGNDVISFFCSIFYMMFHVKQLIQNNTDFLHNVLEM